MPYLVLEIGTEEIPVGSAPLALRQLEQAIPEKLNALRISHGALYTTSTPRRLIVTIEDVADRQADAVREVRGPSADVAFGADGAPTKAAEGFARKQGVEVSMLRVADTPQGQYIVAEVHEVGKPSIEVLGAMFTDVLKTLSFPKMMRWGDCPVRFVRPVRWICALLDDAVIPMEFTGVNADRFSRGHRFLNPEPFPVPHANQFFTCLSQRHIMAHFSERRATIVQQSNALAAEMNAQVVWDEELLDEITNLVEYPTALIGRFDPAFLDLPRCVLVTAMKKHQRYLPLASADGQLLPAFVTVRNGDDHRIDIVRDGNERVLTARFNDARFFFERDLATPFAQFVDRLDRLVFQEKLGTMRQKAERLEAMARQFGGDMAARAALLCKADLPTEMVIELTSLQGAIGEEYARRSGEPEEIAVAIREHYQPRHAEDALPATELGRLIAILDRVDTLTGYVVTQGITPSGSADPFGLRRAATGLIQLIQAHDTPISLWELVARATEQYKTQGIGPSDTGLAALDELITARMEWLLEQDGAWQHTDIEALLADRWIEPQSVARRAAFYRTLPKERLEPVALAATRVRNILRSEAASHCVSTQPWQPPLNFVQAVNTDLFAADAEHVLYNEITDAIHSIPTPVDEIALWNCFDRLTDPVNRFFDDVLVMDDDHNVRINRLRLLATADALYRQFCDFSKLVI